MKLATIIESIITKVGLMRKIFSGMGFIFFDYERNEKLTL